jgi:hypothetical protein
MVFRRHRVVLVAALAALSLSAMSAQSAMAADSGLVAGSGATKVEGAMSTTIKFVFGAGGTTFKCTISTVQGGIQGGLMTKRLSLSPRIEGCVLAGVVDQVSVGTCKFELSSTSNPLSMSQGISGCSSGAPITLTTPSTGCIVTIGNQGEIGTASLETTGENPHRVVMGEHIGGLKYEGNNNCPAEVRGAHADGIVTGSYQLRAYSGGTEVGLTAQ